MDPNTHQILSRVYAAQKDSHAADELIASYMPFIRSETAKFLKRPPDSSDDALPSYTSKISFILEVASIKHRLKAEYNKALAEEVSRLAKDIAEGKGETEEVESVSLSGEKTIIKVRKPKY